MMGTVKLVIGIFFFSFVLYETQEEEDVLCQFEAFIFEVFIIYMIDVYHWMWRDH